MITSVPLLLLLTVAAPDAGATRSGDLAGDWPAHVSGKKVTVEAKTPDEALKEIAAAAGWGLALNSGPAGSAPTQFSFRKIGVEEALTAVLSVSNLKATRIGDTVAIIPRPAAQARADEDEDVDAQKEAAENSAEAAADALLGDAGAISNGDAGVNVVIDLRGLHKGKGHHHRHASNGPDEAHLGQDVDIPAGSKVGDVVAVGGSIHVGAGASTNDLVAIGGSIETEPGAVVAGDAISVGGSAHLGAGTSVTGDSVTLGGTLELDPGATVSGQQINLGLGRLFAFGGPALFAGGLTILFLVSKLAQFVLFFCLGALLLFAAPTQLANIEASMLRQPVRAGLIGFLVSLAIPVLTVLLIVTLVGIPLVAVEFFGIALAVLMGFTAMSVVVGQRLQIPTRGGGLLGLAVGTAIVVALTALPWIGWLVLATGWFVALGAALGTRFGSVPAA